MSSPGPSLSHCPVYLFLGSIVVWNYLASLFIGMKSWVRVACLPEPWLQGLAEVLAPRKGIREPLLLSWGHRRRGWGVLLDYGVWPAIEKACVFFKHLDSHRSSCCATQIVVLSLALPMTASPGSSLKFKFPGLTRDLENLHLHRWVLESVS